MAGLRRISNDPRIAALVIEMVKQGWHAERGKCHDVLLTPDRRQKLPIPKTPSCARAYLNFRSNLRRLQAQLSAADDHAVHS